MATNTRDPRTLITPDAFSVSPEMLGLPLAPPGRRFASIVIDLLVIAVLTMITSDLKLVIWGVVGLFFLQMTFRKPGRKMSNVTAWLFRGATGCLGLMILTGVGIGYLAIRFSDTEAAEEVLRGIAESAEVDFEGLEEGDVETLARLGNMGTPTQGEATSGFAGLIGMAGRMAVAAELARVEDPDEAREILWATLDAADESGLEPSALPGLMAALVNEEAEFTDDPEEFRREVLADWARDRGVALDEIAVDDDAVAEATTEVAEVEKAVEQLTTAQLLSEWARRVEAGDTLISDPRALAVRTRVRDEIAGDTLATLTRRNERLESALDESRASLDEARTAMEAGAGGVTELLRDIWEQLGSAFGLWSIYFTVMLSLFGGRTVGKIATGTRVVRLDGEPINWWAAFERCGGYFAGIATGLLGFVQVYWDPNRQCVHDKIVGTAVVLSGRKAVPGNWQAAAGFSDVTVAPDPRTPPSDLG